MSDAYRTTTNTCPSCAAPLREFGKRLVCDACGGLFLAVEDFVGACTELTGDIHPPTFRDEEPSTTSCPRCSSPLVSCQLAVGKRKLKPTVMRCERDGVWFPPGSLPEMFAVLGRQSHGGMSTYNSAPTSGRREDTPFALHQTSGNLLRISQRPTVRKPSRPAPRPVDAYADTPLHCPACADKDLGFAGDRWVCSECTGTFVQNAALIALVEDMTSTPFELPEVAHTSGKRDCPVCRERMVVEELGGTRIDRCAIHGLWFDTDELQAALEDITAPERTSLVDWISRLFGKKERPDERE